MKTQHTRIVLLVTVALLAALFLAACGAVPSEEPADEAAPEEEVAEQAPDEVEAAPPEEAEEAEEEAVEEAAPADEIEVAEEAAVTEEPATTEEAPTDIFAIPLDHPFAPFLESRAFAAANGGTAEWRKMEGVALDTVNNRFYMAITEVTRGMSDGEGDIQLQENPCGAVYMGQLDADWNISSLTRVVIGGPWEENDDGSISCDPDNIAHPDNVYVDFTGRLWISEDSDGLHPNDMLWTWDGQELKRFATVPMGAEVTGLHIAENGSLFMNVQHPSAENLYPFNAGTIGVVVGFDASDDFTALPMPEGDERLVARVAAGQYQVLARAGDPIPNDTTEAVFGLRTTAEGEILAPCNKPDGNMFLPINGAGTEGYLYTNFECRPGGVAQTYIRQQDGGFWEVVEGKNVDFRPVNGSRYNCFASVTPWNTGLTSEEAEPITGEGWRDDLDVESAYLGRQANPYDYGWIIELAPSGGTTLPGTEVTKRYAMGRFSHEVAVVMPDGQTVYHGDDTNDGVFFKFIADTPGDLSVGTLYAAAVTQNDDLNFSIEWVELGHASDADIAAAIRELDPVS